MKRFKNHQVVLALTFLIGSLFMLFGCGGGGSNATAPGPASSGTISGAAVKGPVNGATVTAYTIENGARGTQLASAMTDTLGNFTMNVDNYSGPIMLLMSGGTYTDEATGSVMSMSMGMNDVMTALIPSVSSGATVTGIQVTPLTSMAQAMAANMASGMTATNINAANTALGNYFMVNDILHTTPMNPLVSESGTGATQDMKNYGIALAAISQYAQAVGMPDSSGMVTAMMNDASDGIMNGMMGSTGISMGSMSGGMMGGGTMMQSTAGTTGLATAMTAFMSSAMNQSGLTISDVQALISRLSTTNGTI